MSQLEPIPHAQQHKFKEKFIERYSNLTDWEEFKKYNLCFLRRSIRINTLLSPIKEIKKSIEAKKEVIKMSNLINKMLELFINCAVYTIPVSIIYRSGNYFVLDNYVSYCPIYEYIYVSLRKKILIYLFIKLFNIFSLSE